MKSLIKRSRFAQALPIGFEAALSGRKDVFDEDDEKNPDDCDVVFDTYPGYGDRGQLSLWCRV